MLGKFRLDPSEFGRLSDCLRIEAKSCLDTAPPRYEVARPGGTDPGNSKDGVHLDVRGGINIIELQIGAATRTEPVDHSGPDLKAVKELLSENGRFLPRLGEFYPGLEANALRLCNPESSMPVF